MKEIKTIPSHTTRCQKSLADAVKVKSSVNPVTPPFDCQRILFIIENNKNQLKNGKEIRPKIIEAIRKDFMIKIDKKINQKSAMLIGNSGNDINRVSEQLI